MRSIIVEGCDNTGKSTLIDRLSRELKIPVQVSCRSLPVDEQIDWMKEKLSKGPFIFDRFAIISESVYGPLLRKEVKFPLKGKKPNSFHTIMKDIVIPANPIIIYCDPGLESILSTIEEREQMEGVAKNVKELLHRYRALIYLISHETPLSIVRYNYNKCPHNYLLTTLQRRLLEGDVK